MGGEVLNKGPAKIAPFAGGFFIGRGNRGFFAKKALMPSPVPEGRSLRDPWRGDALARLGDAFQNPPSGIYDRA
jgi:hypothetical protein